MKNSKDLLSLVYQRQQAGDTRALGDILKDVQKDMAALFPDAPEDAPDKTNDPKAVVGQRHTTYPDGTEEKIEFLADGTERQIA